MPAATGRQIGTAAFGGRESHRPAEQTIRRRRSGRVGCADEEGCSVIGANMRGRYPMLTGTRHCHVESRRVAADFRDRGGLRARRIGFWLDAEGAQKGRIFVGIRGSPCIALRSTRSRAQRRSGWARRRFPAGRSVPPITGGADRERFRADIADVVHTHLNEEATKLVLSGER